MPLSREPIRVFEDLDGSGKLVPQRAIHEEFTRMELAGNRHSDERQTKP